MINLLLKSVFWGSIVALVIALIDATISKSEVDTLGFFIVCWVAIISRTIIALRTPDENYYHH